MDNCNLRLADVSIVKCRSVKIFLLKLKSELPNLHRFFIRILFIRITRLKIVKKYPKNILRIMARLKYMINNLESPILILHQESVLFTVECLLFTMEGFQFRKTCVRNQHTNQSKHS